MGNLGLFFASVPDPRAGNARHDLSELLFIAFAAMMCGAESCVDMAEFGAAKADLLRSVLSLEHGVPSHDTFGRLFRLLDPDRFEMAFRRFMERFAAALSGQVGTAGQVVAIDGKSLRGAVDAARRTQPLHLVTAWAAEQRLDLGVQRAPWRSEVTAAREIIALLDLTDTTVTADALHGSRATAMAIRARQGHYALAIKGNAAPCIGPRRTCSRHSTRPWRPRQPGPRTGERRTASPGSCPSPAWPKPTGSMASPP